MIVVRNTKEEQRKALASQQSVYMHPPVRAAVSLEAGQLMSDRSGEVTVDGPRLSREVQVDSFRNGHRLQNEAGTHLSATKSDTMSTRFNHIHQQRPYTHRSGLAPPPPQPTIWSISGNQYTHQHRHARNSANWHQHSATTSETRSPSQHQQWHENRAVGPSNDRRPGLTRVNSRHWGWNSQTAPRQESRPAPEERYPSQHREWSVDSNWQGSGHGSSITRERAESIFISRPAATYDRNGSMVHATSLNHRATEDFDLGRKRSQEENVRQLDAATAATKRSKGMDMLDLLCQATLDVGPMQDNPTGCSCPKSKCVALYCDCFKAGRRCDEKNCGCIDCKNTVAESGIDGARTKAIRSILARNPRAFVTAGVSAAEKRAPPGEIACNCIRSRCLKLYCSCFQNGKTCTQSCTCVGCSNTEEDSDGERKLAVQLCLEKRPDAFQQRVREPGLGCACKNNRCVRKYCECFRSDLICTDKCTCRRCENRTPNEKTSV